MFNAWDTGLGETIKGAAVPPSIGLPKLRPRGSPPIIPPIDTRTVPITGTVTAPPLLVPGPVTTWYPGRSAADPPTCLDGSTPTFIARRGWQCPYNRGPGVMPAPVPAPSRGAGGPRPPIIVPTPGPATSPVVPVPVPPPTRGPIQVPYEPGRPRGRVLPPRPAEICPTRGW